MASDTHVPEVYSHYAKDALACVVEGVMGLFDGYDRMKGSSAEIAAMLNLPVVVILNARSSAYTVALGYRTAQYRGMQLKGHEFHYSGSTTGLVAFRSVSV